MPEIFAGTFQVLGGSDPGMKVRDLQDHASIVSASGARLLGGPVIALEVFDHFLFYNGLDASASSEQILSAEVPPLLSEVIDAILSSLEPGCCYFLRSTARSERGGIGVYRSPLYQHTGNLETDRREFTRRVLEVYACEFTKGAVAWRLKTGGKIGMAVLVHQGVGQPCDNGFSPRLSGRGYTNYHGRPILRVALGLSTEESLLAATPLRDGNPESISEVVCTLLQGPRYVGNANGVFCRASEEESDLESVLALAWENLLRLADQGSFYFEWAFQSGTDEVIVQIAPYDFADTETSDYDPQDAQLVGEGESVIGNGVITSKTIVVLSPRAWLKDGTAILETADSRFRDYILVVPDAALSTQAEQIAGSVYAGRQPTYGISHELGLQHFSNAACVIEYRGQFAHLSQLTVDHHGNRAAQHFQQLCDRLRISFFSTDSLQLEEAPSTRLYDELALYSGTFVVTLDSTVDCAALYAEQFVVDNSETRRASEEDWSLQLRLIANRLGDMNRGNDLERQRLVTAIYDVHYTLGADVAEMAAEFGKEQLLESVRLLLEHGETLLSDIWCDDLQTCLLELQKELQALPES